MVFMRGHLLVKFVDSLVHVRCSCVLVSKLTEPNAHSHLIVGRRRGPPAVPENPAFTILLNPVHAPLRALQILLPIASFGVDVRHVPVYAAGMIESKHL